MRVLCVGVCICGHVDMCKVDYVVCGAKQVWCGLATLTCIPSHSSTHVRCGVCNVYNNTLTWLIVLACLECITELLRGEGVLMGTMVFIEWQVHYSGTYSHNITFTCGFLCRTLIVENFIPPDDVSRFKQRAVFDEETEEWKLTTAVLPAR